MAATTIIVQHRDGTPARGAKVTLSFDYGGITDSQLTNREGEVTIIHSTTGSAKIIVNGKTYRTGYRTPGTTSITLS